MRKTAAVSLVAAALAAGCSPIQDTKAADAQIAAFHQKLNAQDFAGIYGAAGPELRASATQDVLVRGLSAVHRRLGNFQSGTDTGWYDKVTTNGHFLTINYSAKYDRAAATESFPYRVEGAQALLVAFNITSPALIPD